MNNGVFHEYLGEVLSGLRSPQTKEDSLRILKFLNGTAPNWTRSKDLATSVPTQFNAQFFRLVKRLAAAGIIEVHTATESRAPGRKAVYYRLTRKYPVSCFNFRGPDE